MGRPRKKTEEVDVATKLRFPIRLFKLGTEPGVHSEWHVKPEVPRQPYLLRVKRHQGGFRLTCTCHWGDPAYVQFGPCVHALSFLNLFNKKIKTAKTEVDQNWMILTRGKTPGSTTYSYLQLLLEAVNER